MSDTMIMVLFWSAIVGPVLLGAAILKGIEALGRKYPRPPQTKPNARKSSGWLFVFALQLALGLGLLLLFVKTVKWMWYL